MARESGQIATVVGQDGNNVLVSLPMVGFPNGFELRAGERVVVVAGEDGRPAVMPLVSSTVVRGGAKRAAAEPLEVAGQRATTQAATVVNEGDGSDLVVWIVDPGTAEGPPQVIATRQD